METLKKTSRFLGFSPLAGFLRVRYPSTILSRNVDEAGPAETDEVAESSSAIDGSDINPERHDADREMDGETQAAGDSALEPGIPAQATNNLNSKVADRAEEATDVEADTDSQTVRAKGLLPSAWKVQ